ncbi:MAG: hypothetical protein HY904_06270 [Deltaproteobacteria bacterium]|nr:hypothetical protein [Deltaproteobacteria bacterium]
MILHDHLLEDLPERVREVAVRVRDLILSLGTGVTEQLRGKAVEFGAPGRLARLTADRGGVTLTLFGPLPSPLHDRHGKLRPAGKGAEIRLGSTADLDDELRRLLRDTYARMHAVGSPERRHVDVKSAVPPALREPLENFSRTLRLWVHALQVAEKMERQRQLQESRAGQKRSHKKKAPAVPPPLPLPEEIPAPPERTPPPPPRAPAKKPAARKATAKKTQRPPAARRRTRTR